MGDPLAIAELVITAAIALGAFMFVRGHGGGMALDELVAANKVLEGRVSDLVTQSRRDQQTIALLDSRTSLEPMVAAVVEQFVQHETRAQARHDQAMVVWSLIAARLGPETDDDDGQG
jgi:hypothetical protein